MDQGFPRLFAAGIFGLTGLMSTAGRVLFGIAADRIGRPASATPSYACTALGTLCLLGLSTWRHPAALYAYALLFGLGLGAWFGGLIHDLTGSYRLVFLIAVGFCAMGTACFWLARPPRRS